MAGKQPENVKGIAASAKTGIVYVTSLTRMIAIDAVSGKKLWDKSYEGGCDRMAISPDGKTLYRAAARRAVLARGRWSDRGRRRDHHSGVRFA